MITNLKFEDILPMLKQGGRAAREGWNGKNMFIEIRITGWNPDGTKFTGWAEKGHGNDMYKDGKLLPFIIMKTAQGDYTPWLASQTDLLAEDWNELI